MKQIAYTKDTIVYLNTGLNEEMFAKTKSSLLMKEKAFIVKDNNFTPWTFDYTQTIDEQVYFCGKDFNGKPVIQFFEENSLETNKIILKICNAYKIAEENNIDIPINSPNGILYDGESLLFLPEIPFDKSCANCGKALYESLQNQWRDSIANKTESLQYARSVLAYYGLTKTVPYPYNINVHNAINISDRNFTPIEFCINGINNELANAINIPLSGLIYEKTFPIELLKEQLLNPEKTVKIMDDNLFQLQKEKFIKKQQKKIERSRKFRKNISTIIGSAIALVIVLICTFAIIHENGRKPSVIGLKSTDVVKIFYSGLHNMDTDKMLVSAKDCPQAQRYISLVPQIYITSQMRSAYNFESGISTPENWVLFEPNSSKAYNHVLYGLSQFKINEKPDTLRIKMPTKSNHAEKLVKEDNEILKSTSERTHKVEYYLVHTVDNLIEIEKHTDFVSLSWAKNKWKIIKLDQTSYTEKLSPEVFQKEYQKAFLEYNDIYKALDSLRNKYKWIPYEESIKEEDEYLRMQGF